VCGKSVIEWTWNYAEQCGKNIKEKKTVGKKGKKTNIMCKNKLEKKSLSQQGSDSHTF